jgi:hypothetical protein
VGLAGPITEPLRGDQCGALGGGPVVPVPPPVKERDKDPGDLPGVAIEAGAGSVRDDCDQYTMLGLQPGQRLVGVDQADRLCAGLRQVQGQRSRAE